MKKLIREFFYLRKGERRSLLFVTALLLVSVAFRIWLTAKPVEETIPDPAIIEAMKALQDKISETKIKKAGTNFKAVQPEKKLIIPFYFDPNSISVDSLNMMNLSADVIRNLSSYRNSGGYFRNPEDISKIYGLDSTDLKTIVPYIRIKKKRSRDLKNQNLYTLESTLVKIDINSADSVELTNIPGIGPSYSRRIIKYRQLLGGYFKLSQLWEIYGMDSIRFSALSRYCEVDTNKIEKINLNITSFKELISHPYLSKSDTYSILHYIDFEDTIVSLKELNINQIIDHDTFMKIQPYLCVKESN